MKMAKASKQDIRAMADFFLGLEEKFGSRWFPGDPTDEELGELVRQFWPKVDSAWRRVVFGCEMLIENCCDPNLNYLEWLPDVKAFLDSKEKTPAAESGGDDGDDLGGEG